MQNRVNRFFVAIHDLQDAFWQARFLGQFRQHQWHGGITLGWFEDERITASDGGREHPHRDHGREVERCDACGDPQCLTH